MKEESRIYYAALEANVFYKEEDEAYLGCHPLGRPRYESRVEMTDCIIRISRNRIHSKIEFHKKRKDSYNTPNNPNTNGIWSKGLIDTYLLFFDEPICHCCHSYFDIGETSKILNGSSNGITDYLFIGGIIVISDLNSIFKYRPYVSYKLKGESKWALDCINKFSPKYLVSELTEKMLDDIFDVFNEIELLNFSNMCKSLERFCPDIRGSIIEKYGESMYSGLECGKDFNLF